MKVSELSDRLIRLKPDSPAQTLYYPAGTPSKNKVYPGEIFPVWSWTGSDNDLYLLSPPQINPDGFSVSVRIKDGDASEWLLLPEGTATAANFWHNPLEWGKQIASMFGGSLLKVGGIVLLIGGAYAAKKLFF